MAVARSKIEDFDKMKERVEHALKLLENDQSRIVLAPDCGLGFLTEEQILAKLDVMVKVAKDLNQKAWFHFFQNDWFPFIILPGSYNGQFWICK